MTRRPIVPPAVGVLPVVVQHHALPDRPLGGHRDLAGVDVHWSVGLLPAKEMAYGIVWVKPPPDADPSSLIALLKEKGAHVKLLPPDRVDDVVTEARPDAQPELGQQDAREVVYELCRELAPRAGVPVDDVLREVETYMSAAGL